MDYHDSDCELMGDHDATCMTCFCEGRKRIAELERELAAIKGQEPVAEVRLVSEQRLISGADMGLGCSDGYVTDRYLKLMFINYRMHNPDNGAIKDGDKLYALPVASADKDAERAAKYEELLYAVARKFPNETRHETALRYIRQAENQPDQCCAAMAKGGPSKELQHVRSQLENYKTPLAKGE